MAVDLVEDMAEGFAVDVADDLGLDMAEDLAVDMTDDLGVDMAEDLTEEDQTGSSYWPTKLVTSKPLKIASSDTLATIQGRFISHELSNH